MANKPTIAQAMARGDWNPANSWIVETADAHILCDRSRAVGLSDELTRRQLAHTVRRWDGEDYVPHSSFAPDPAPVVTGQGEFQRSYTPEVPIDWLALLALLAVISAVAWAVALLS